MIRENELKVELARWFKGQGYMVFIDVKHNAKGMWRELNSGTGYMIGFSPDADIIAYHPEKREFIGVEVKGYRHNKKKNNFSLPKLWEGLGEAMLYLANPVIIDSSSSQKIRGGLFDMVYLCYPDARVFEESFMDVINLTPIGLLAWDGEVKIVRDAKPNPLANENVKDIFMRYLGDFIEGYGFDENINGGR